MFLKRLLNDFNKRVVKNKKGIFPALMPLVGAGLKAAAPSLIGGGLGMLQNALSGGGGGTSGYDMPTMTPSPWDYQNQKLSSEFAQNYMNQAMQGELPSGLEAMLDRIRKDRLRQSHDQMYGSGGRVGGSDMDVATSVGAMGGLGPRALVAQTDKALQNYSNRNAQIGNYIDSMKFSGVQDANNRAMGIMQQMPRSMDIPWTGQLPQVNQPAAPGIDFGLDKVDFSGMFNKSPKTTSTQTPWEPPPMDPYKPLSSGNDINYGL